MAEKILFVDDEENILSAFRRQLRTQFAIETASSGEAGLSTLIEGGPFAVVVSDLRMPGMDGVDFLSKAKELAPDTIRIMLTGNADLDTAINAVNDGNIFRFLTKPCPADLLGKTLQFAVDQYRLIHAERELMEKTLNQSVQLLTEMLSLSNPNAFSRALRARRVVRRMATNLNLSDVWQIELAAMLSQVGCVAISAAILEREALGEDLDPTEKSMIASHPVIGYSLLRNIARLEEVALMVRDQQKPYVEFALGKGEGSTRKTDMGAQLLKVALDYDRLLQAGATHLAALEMLSGQASVCNPRLVAALGQIEILKDWWDVRLANASTLEPGMILRDDLHSKDGHLLISKRQEVSLPMLEKIQMVTKKIGVIEPFRVLVKDRSGIEMQAQL